MDAITLDQFAVFLAIVEEGSFAAAARRLGRAQSAVTYAVQKLEDQCGVTLFDRSSYRPTLTEQGRALLPRIRRIMEDLGEFRVQAQSMAQEVEAELVLVVETFVPLSLIAPALRQFHAAFPMVQLRIIAVRPQDATNQLVAHRADLGLFMQSPNPAPDLDSRRVTGIDFVAVAAPDHPLAKLPPQFPKEAMRDHLQIVVSNPRPSGDASSYGVVGVNQWHVSEVRLRHDLIRQGIGWGSMPRPMVEADLARGDLVVLQPAQWDSTDTMPSFTIVVARRKEKALGPAGRFLLAAISARQTG
ncbi:LysR family transcriptional regulator [Seohaeicola saemankumensis]|uniref:LysR family transcriptional regulator n=1 Tax=Seohaeicola saemankumensis TaxID=481181 RepID=A0ABW3TGU4_9RHOB